MSQYVVQSGSLSIVLVAESALDAAIEAVQRWGHGADRSVAEHRGGFDEQIIVQRGRRGACRQFPTFNVLARARGESPEIAWRRLLARNLTNVN